MFYNNHMNVYVSVVLYLIVLINLKKLTNCRLLILFTRRRVFEFQEHGELNRHVTLRITYGETVKCSVLDF